MSAIQRTILFTAVGTALALFAFGCSEQSDAPTPPKPAERAPAPPPDEAPAPPPAPPAPAKAPESPPTEGEMGEADVEAGKADYKTYCSSCHGETGAGDGPLGQVLNPKPARHNDGAYMNPLTYEHLFKVIKFGGASVGKSPTMAPLGLSDQQIHNVIAFIRTLADPPYQP
jgi:mono/diheme cytochrome c family protein